MKKFLVLLIVFLVQAVFTAPCYAIKIGLVTHASRAVIGTSSQGQIVNAQNNKQLYVMDKMKAYEFRAYQIVLLLKFRVIILI